ncbi:MAG: carbohydrate kinase [Meiothermus sp.]
MVVLTGEIKVDLIGRNGPKDDRLEYGGTLGGAALNTASTLARLGTPVRLVGEVGDDFLGEWALGQLEARRLETRFVRRLEGIPTPLALAQIDPSGDAAYSFYRNFGETCFEPDKGALARAKWFHFGSGYAFEGRNIAGLRGMLEVAREYEIPVSFDPNLRHPPEERYFAQLQGYLPYISVFKASLEDARWLFPRVSPEPHVLMECLSELGVPITVMTLGPDGAMATFRSRMTRVPGVKVKVVDTVGAGDTFTAALIYGLMKQELGSRIELLTWDGTRLPVVLAAACHLSALACTVAGPNVPERELQTWWERFG